MDQNLNGCEYTCKKEYVMDVKKKAEPEGSPGVYSEDKIYQCKTMDWEEE